ncbi:SAM-dependent methyltransferase [Paucihalobacter ruber]|uniref:SAM-dependent methyltransferase n=2 Tax=Paucihalobacter ruber TaxID=2567861 RepID=A0A506PKR4_9FLAO|nr:SAM-dependent methyltransferase [Paucihalobacter ruber]
MLTFNADYWNQRYKTDETGWDLGHVSQPIKAYIDQLDNKDLNILIPGAGNSYEAEYLWHSGFENIYIIDIAPVPLINFKNRLPEFPDNQIILGNFFELNITFDLIIEQTFFCALAPSIRKTYATKSAELLHNGGKIAGLLFDFPLTEKGPPFGGSLSEYQNLFNIGFNLKTMERCYNSEPSRENKELFIIFEKRKV